VKALFLAFLCTLGCAEPENVATLEMGSIVSEQQHYTLTVTPVKAITRGLNAFTSERAIPEGTRVTGGEALMPAHGHASSMAVIRTEETKTTIDRLDLNMPGRWEITLSLTGAQGADSVRFAVEVP
jgi:hypothetical protein